MPRHDQTGPQGQGPMTGRRMGTCVGAAQSESSFNFGFGNGFRGRRNAKYGLFRNRNNSFQGNYEKNQTSAKNLIEVEISNLKKRLEILEDELGNLN